MMEISSHLRNILRKKIVTVQILVFFFCGLSYLLLYSFFSREMFSVFLNWQDYDFHLRLLRILEGQSGYIPFFDSTPVPYPVFFHNVVRIVSAVFGFPSEASLFLVSCAAGFGATFLIFLIVTEFSDRLAGFFGALLCGVGANFVIFFFKTIFFGGAFIFPASYMVAGFLPNLMGHFFGLSMVYVIIKGTLQKGTHILFCAFLGAMVILSHPFAAMAYLIAIFCLFFSSHITDGNIKFRQLGIILILSIALSSPWWLRIVPELSGKSYLILLSDAGKTWIRQDFLREIVEYYGFIPIFSVLGAFYLIRNFKTGIFLPFWAISFFILLFTPWGARFALELAVPLYMLGAIGMSHTIRWALSEENEQLAVRLASLTFVFTVFCDSIRIFDIIRNIFIQNPLRLVIW